MPLIFAPESGEAIIGSERISFVPVGDDGSVRVEGRSGSIIRPLRFGERTRLLVDALQADNPPAFCSDLLVHTATNSPADTLSAEEKVLALVLAGGNIDAPSLSRTVAVVAEATGWPKEIIAAKTAIEIDRMAFDLTSHNSGWNKIVFPLQGADDVDAIIGELTTVLLNRTDEAMIRLMEDGLSRAAVPEGSDVRIRERESQPAQAESFPDKSPFFPQEPAGFSSSRFAGFSRIPAEPPGASSSRSRIGGTVFPLDQHPGSGISIPLPLAEDRSAPNSETPEPQEGFLSVDSSSTPSSVRQSGQSADSSDLTSRRHLEPFEGSGPLGRSEREKTGGFLSESRKDGLPPVEERIPVNRIFPEKARNSRPEVQQPEGKRFDLPAAPFRIEGASEAGVLDRNPLQRPGSETLPNENGPKPERRISSRQPLFMPGNHTDRRAERDQAETGMEQERFPAGNGEERGGYASVATERSSPSMVSQRILDAPVAGSTPIPSFAKVNRDWGKDLLSTLDDLDLAALADEIGRLLAAEADLRGID